MFGRYYLAEQYVFAEKICEFNPEQKMWVGRNILLTEALHELANSRLHCTTEELR